MAPPSLTLGEREPEARQARAGGSMQARKSGSDRFHPSRFALHSLVRRAVGFLVVLAACAAFVGAAKAGLLEDLFGGDETPTASRVTAGRPAAPRKPRVEHVRRPVERPAPILAHARPAYVVPIVAAPIPAQASASPSNVKPKPTRFCAPLDKTAPIADSTQALMRDATLRYGDVIVTDEGVRVFEGSGACPHAVSNFRTLAETRILSPGTRTALAQIELDLKTKGSRRADPAILAADSASR